MLVYGNFIFQKGAWKEENITVYVEETGANCHIRFVTQVVSY